MKNRSLHIIPFICCIFLAATKMYCQENKSTVQVFLDQTSLQITEQKKNLTNNAGNSISRTVQIQQIGRNNRVNTNTISATNQTQILQFGEKNDIFQELIAGRIQNTFVQSGYENSVVHLNTSGSKSHTATVVQYGLRQNLIWVGDNSLSQNMVVRMRGKKQTVLIRNRK
ncbi:MAG TPA: hypothetical protein EYO35_11735 [Flavobacteriaceae bacterium]|nr:hypothetical protein [Flavobacteriaceae bacterium]